MYRYSLKFKFKFYNINNLIIEQKKKISTLKQEEIEEKLEKRQTPTSYFNAQKYYYFGKIFFIKEKKETSFTYIFVKNVWIYL